MFPARRRIGRALVKDTIARGKGFNSEYFKLKVLSLDDSNAPSLFAVVVSKKVAQKAALRNRYRRRVQAALGSMMESIKPGYAIVVFPTKDTINLKYEELVEQIAESFKKAKLI